MTAKMACLPVHLWYVTFCISVLGWSVVVGPLLGSNWYAADTKHRDFAHNLLSEMCMEAVAYALGGGAMVSVANGILIYMIARVG